MTKRAPVTIAIHFMLKNKVLLLCLFVLTFFIYKLTSAGNTPYNYFTFLSDSLLRGEYWLTNPPPWLNELVPGPKNRFFVVYPPMPSILGMPFVAIWGKEFPQQYLAHLIGVVTSLLFAKMAYVIKRDKKFAFFAFLTSAFGSILWYMSSAGSAWYLGQLTACMFMTAAILETLEDKNPYVTGVLIGASYLARLQTILGLPFFLVAFLSRNPKKTLKSYLLLAMGILPFVFFNFTYNFVRYGTVIDKGYVSIPGVLDEPWYQAGLLSPVNIPRHAEIFFLKLPKFKDQVPYILPSWGGLAIWITTPVVLFSFFAKLRNKMVLSSWVSVILIAILVFSYGSTGFTQFGYRYAVDFYPFLFFLIFSGIARNKKGLRWYHWLLLFIGIGINLWGVLWINKFGWVEF